MFSAVFLSAKVVNIHIILELLGAAYRHYYSWFRGAERRIHKI